MKGAFTLKWTHKMDTTSPPPSILESSTYRNYVGRGCLPPTQDELLDERLSQQFKLDNAAVFSTDAKRAKREIEAVDFLLAKHYGAL